MEFRASAIIGEGEFYLFIDSELIALDSETCMYRKELEAKTHYIFHWFVKGKPGIPYYITVSSPKEAEFQLTRGISSTGKDVGAIRFSS